MTGTAGVVRASVGQCGDTAYYALYSDGSLQITGSGAIYDDAFLRREEISKVMLSEGITKIGDYAFSSTGNDMILGVNYGTESINISSAITSIGERAFQSTRLKTITIPSSVVAIGDNAFNNSALTTAKIESPLMGSYMFVRCSNLRNLTVSKNCKTFGSNMLTYCSGLSTITYEGTITQWNAITKPTNWICSADNYWNGYLTKIQCTDGYLSYDETNHTWNEVKS